MLNKNIYMTEKLPKSPPDLQASVAALALKGAIHNSETVGLPADILSQTEFNKWLQDQKYTHFTRGTYRNESNYAYIKPCHTLDSATDVEAGLAFARLVTTKGILHPGTQWGAYKLDDKPGYQLVPVSPVLHVQSPAGNRTESEHEFRAPYIPGSHIDQWVKRLDPAVESDQAVVDGSLVRALNVQEALHPDNWGWDETGTNYPVDVEVLDIAGSIGMIRQWYADQSSTQPATQ
jgi:hypothetical protein